MVVPGYHVVQCCLAFLSYPSVSLFYKGVASNIGKKGCQSDVRCSSHGRFPWRIKNRPSIAIRMSDYSTRLDWWQRACVTLKRNEEWKAVIT